MVKLLKHHSSVEVYRSVEVCIHIFQTLTVGGDGRQVYATTNILVEKQQMSATIQDSRCLIVR